MFFIGIDVYDLGLNQFRILLSKLNNIGCSGRLIEIVDKINRVHGRHTVRYEAEVLSERDRFVMS